SASASAASIPWKRSTTRLKKSRNKCVVYEASVPATTWQPGLFNSPFCRNKGDLIMSITLTEKAAGEVKRIISEQQQAGGAPEKIYLRMRVVGGGCSGFQHKLDLDPQVNDKLDEV